MINPKYSIAIRQGIDFLQTILFVWVVHLVKLSIGVTICLLVIQFIFAPVIVFARTGVLVMIPFKIEFIYKMIKVILFSATSVTIILLVSAYVFPEDTKTKKYWWNKELNSKRNHDEDSY